MLDTKVQNETLKAAGSGKNGGQMIFWHNDSLQIYGEWEDAYRFYDTDYLFWVCDMSEVRRFNDSNRAFLQRFNGSLLKLQGKALRKAS